MTKTAILYARVSTPKQVEKGYSLDQQIESLRQYAAEHVLEILEEIRDAGYSGATLDRPGMDRILEAVAGGGVDVVLAQDADRITREPWHFGYLKARFERYGTKLCALDDRDDETPEGEFFAEIRRGMSKMERQYTNRRTRRGKEKKVRSGKLLGSGPPPYGFQWVRAKQGSGSAWRSTQRPCPSSTASSKWSERTDCRCTRRARSLSGRDSTLRRVACGAWA
jgi:site-specific DNA recombinase